MTNKILINKVEAHEAFLDQMPGCLVIKDTDSKFQLMNKLNKNWVGFKPNTDITGLTDFDMKCKAVKFADEFIRQDKLAFERGGLRYLGYFNYDRDDWKITFAEKKVIRDHDNQTIGVSCYMTDITHTRIFDIARFLMKYDDEIDATLYKEQFCYILDDNYLDFDLSPRQSECLFFLLRGYTVKTIAKILDLSQRTVEAYVEDIKNILRCDNKSQLIEKAWRLGYMSILPNSLFKKAN